MISSCFMAFSSSQQPDRTQSVRRAQNTAWGKMEKSRAGRGSEAAEAVHKDNGGGEKFDHRPLIIPHPGRH
jgi:hypothetical protein